MKTMNKYLTSEETQIQLYSAIWNHFAVMMILRLTIYLIQNQTIEMNPMNLNLFIATFVGLVSINVFRQMKIV